MPKVQLSLRSCLRRLPVAPRLATLSQMITLWHEARNCATPPEHTGASHDRCGLPVACPDGTCYSLYGAYGPWGGPCDNLEMVGQVMDPLIH